MYTLCAIIYIYICVCVKSINMGWRKEVHQPSWDLSSFSCCPFGWLVNRHVGQYVMLLEPPNSQTRTSRTLPVEKASPSVPFVRVLASLVSSKGTHPFWASERAVAEDVTRNQSGEAKMAEKKMFSSDVWLAYGVQDGHSIFGMACASHGCSRGMVSAGAGWARPRGAKWMRRDAACGDVCRLGS
jgi:hypothetical protein